MLPVVRVRAVLSLHLFGAPLRLRTSLEVHPRRVSALLLLGLDQLPVELLDRKAVGFVEDLRLDLCDADEDFFLVDLELEVGVIDGPELQAHQAVHDLGVRLLDFFLFARVGAVGRDEAVYQEVHILHHRLGLVAQDHDGELSVVCNRVALPNFNVLLRLLVVALFCACQTLKAAQDLNVPTHIVLEFLLILKLFSFDFTIPEKGWGKKWEGVVFTFYFYRIRYFNSTCNQVPSRTSVAG